MNLDKLPISYITPSIQANIFMSDLIKEISELNIISEYNIFSLVEKKMKDYLSTKGVPSLSNSFKIKILNRIENGINEKYTNTPITSTYINSLLKSIYIDIFSIFEEINNFESTNLAYYNMVTGMKGRIINQIKRINERLEDYSMYSQGREKDEHWIIESFSTNKMEGESRFYKSPKCDINTEEGVITLKKETVESFINENTKVNIITDTNSVNRVYLGCEKEHSINNITINKVLSKDNNTSFLIDEESADTFWQAEVLGTSLTTSSELKVSIIISNPTKKLINWIAITPQDITGSDRTYIESIEYTDNNVDFKPVNSSIDKNISIQDMTKNLLDKNLFDKTYAYTDKKSVTGTSVITLEPVEATKIKINLYTNTHYSFKDDNNTEWKRLVIAIKNISLYSYSYNLLSEYVSNKYDLDNPIKRISISTNEIIPKIYYNNKLELKNEFIKYYVSLDDGITWNRISPLNHDNTFLEIEDAKILLPKVIRVNTSPTDLDISSSASKNLGYIDKEKNFYSIRLKIEMSRPDKIQHANLYSPILSDYKLQVLVPSISESLDPSLKEYSK